MKYSRNNNNNNVNYNKNMIHKNVKLRTLKKDLMKDLQRSNRKFEKSIKNKKFISMIVHYFNKPTFNYI